MINWSVDWPKIYQRYSDWDLRPPLSLDRLILSIDSLLGNWGILLSWKRILFFDFLSNFPLAKNLQLCALCTCISIITDIRDLLPFLSVSFVSTAAIFCLHHPLAPISIYYSSTCIPVSSSFASNQLSNSISPLFSTCRLASCSGAWLLLLVSIRIAMLTAFITSVVWSIDQLFCCPLVSDSLFKSSTCNCNLSIELHFLGSSDPVVHLITWSNQF